MKNINILLSVIFFLLTFQLKAQLNPSTGADKNRNKKEIEFSIFLGRSFGGPFRDMSASMNGVSVISSSRRGIPYRFDFTYNISQKSGISLTRGSLDAFSIRMDGYAPTIKSMLKSTSLDYVYSLGHNRHEFSTGISFLSHHIKSDIEDNIITGKPQSQKVGINFGYSYHFIERRGFFLAFQAQYNWGGTMEIGPYKIYEHGRTYDLLGLGLFTGTIPSRTTTFAAAKVDLNSFNIGFTMGFRFGDTAATSKTQI
jgi:hypothetical protein